MAIPPYLFISLLFSMVLVPLCAGAENGEKVKIKADTVSYDKEKDLVEAHGNVEVRWGEFTLLSDTASLRQEENQAVAEGSVRLLKRNEYSITSDKVTVNYVDSLGEIEKGRLFIQKRNFHLHGDRFVKTGEDDYQLDRGTFTTCDGEVPSWKFTATDLDVTVEDYATGRNAIFYVKDIPLFYTPWIKFPVKLERQSGFLFPRVGSSTKKGFYFDIPYYFAMSPSQDLTVDLDVQSKRGVGLGGDYRYLRPRQSEGALKSYLIYDTQQDRARGFLTFKGHEFLSPALTLASDINLTLDRNFFRDYAESSGDYNRQILTTTAFLTRDTDHSSLTAEIRYVHDLDAPTNRETLQKLPVISFFQTRNPIGSTPFYVGLSSSLVNFYRDDGLHGQRFDLHPTLAYYRGTPAGIDLSGWIGYRQRLYNAYGENPGSGYHGDGLVDGGVTLSTSLARVYHIANREIKAVRHTLIPELNYNFTEQRNQDRLPFFDYDDRPVEQGLGAWSLTNFFTGKYADLSGSPFYRDLLYLRLSQGYQDDGGRRDLLTPVDEGRPFTDIRVEARYFPLPELSVTTDSRYNPYHTRFSTASLGLALDDGRGNHGGLNYRYARGDVNYLEGDGSISLANPFFFKYNFRYSMDRGAFLETHYSVEYKQQCWSITVAYRDRPDNQEVMVSFTLAGIGSIGPLKTF